MWSVHKLSTGAFKASSAGYTINLLEVGLVTPPVSVH